MNWQDLVFAAGSLIFAIALIPSVRSADKPHITTSIMTAVVLALFCIAYLSLDLYFAAGTVLINSGVWSFLALQKYRQHS